MRNFHQQRIAEGLSSHFRIMYQGRVKRSEIPTSNWQNRRIADVVLHINRMASCFAALPGAGTPLLLVQEAIDLVTELTHNWTRITTGNPDAKSCSIQLLHL
jgi:hypothetical protein